MFIIHLKKINSIKEKDKEFFLIQKKERLGRINRSYPTENKDNTRNRKEL